MNDAMPAREEESAEGSNQANNKGRVALWAMLPVALIGLTVSLYLVWGALVSGKIAGCDSGVFWDCNHVLHSQWSSWFGIPVSIPGAFTYLAVLGCISVLLVSRSPDQTHWAKYGLVLGATVAMLSGLWFIGVQVFAIHKLCQWCLTIHSMSLLLFAIVCYNRFVPREGMVRLASAALVGVMVLALGQVLGPAPKRYEVHRFDVAMPTTTAGDSDVGALVTNVAEPVELDAPADPTWLEAPSLEPPSLELQAASDPIARTDTESTSSVTTAPASAQETVPSLAIRTPLTNKGEIPFDAKEELITAEPIQPVTLQDSVIEPPAPHAAPELDKTPLEKERGPQANRRRLHAIPIATLTPMPDDDAEPQTDDSVANSSDEKPASVPKGRYITFGGNTLNLRMNVVNRPILGSCDAPVVFIELFDYTCPHCREMNRHVAGVRQIYGDQVAFLILPVPLSHYCNAYADGTTAQHQDACELARLAIAVWKLNNAAFPEFHEWLCEPSQGRTAGEARVKAEQLVDPQRLQQLLQSQYVREFLRQHADIYNMVGRGILPKLYSDKIGIVGKTNSVDDLLRQIANSHNLAAAAAPPRR